jgi:hypothetical protein
VSWRNRLIVQFWGQARDLILAYARENNVSKWGAARILICKGAGVEYVRPKRGRAANGYRTVPKRLTPEELHACRVRQGKLLHGEDYVRLPREEVLRRKREAEARRCAAAAAREGRDYEYRPHDAEWKARHDRITAACAVVPRFPGTSDQAHRSRCYQIMQRADAAGMTIEAYLKRLLMHKQCPLSHEEVAALAARIPEKLRTKTRIKKLRSLIANGKTPEEALAWCSEDRRGKRTAEIWAGKRAAGLARPVTVREQRARRRVERAAEKTARESLRLAQTRSRESRRAALLARFNAVCPEPFRARYIGHVRETMKSWRRAAKKHGMAFEAYVAALMAVKAANPDLKNPRIDGRATPAHERRLALAKEREEARLREREEARRKAREDAERLRITKRELVEKLPAGMRTAERKRELLRRVFDEGQDADAAVATILANMAHKTHRGRGITIRSAARAVQEARAAEPPKPKAPSEQREGDRRHNCAICKHCRINRCALVAGRWARANLVCDAWEHDGDDLPAVYEPEQWTI